MSVVQGARHPLAQAQFDAGPVDRSLLIERATVYFRPAEEIGVFLMQLQTPGSPEYHHFLTTASFADRFGATANDVAKVRSWLESNGLQIEAVAKGRLWISFSGTADQVGRALLTQFRRYRVNGETHFANSVEPSVPEAFANIVLDSTAWTTSSSVRCCT
jgi:subtilase family serine protease